MGRAVVTIAQGTLAMCLGWPTEIKRMRIEGGQWLHLEIEMSSFPEVPDGAELPECRAHFRTGKDGQPIFNGFQLDLEGRKLAE